MVDTPTDATASATAMPTVLIVAVHAVLVNEEEPAAAPAPAEMKPSDMATGEASSAAITPATSATTAGKGVLKNIKTMFYVGTEVSSRVNFTA